MDPSKNRGHYDDFCPMLVPLHLRPRRKYITICTHTGIHEPVVWQSRWDDKEDIYPLTTRETAEAQKHAIDPNTMTDKYGYTTQFVENTKVLCKDGKMVIPISRQQRAVARYHHYLQHPQEHSSQGNALSFYVLERAKKDCPMTCQKCHSCQVNKCRDHKYGKLPEKLAITTSWEALCVDHIRPCTLKGNERK